MPAGGRASPNQNGKEAKSRLSPKKVHTRRMYRRRGVGGTGGGGGNKSTAGECISITD